MKSKSVLSLVLAIYTLFFSGKCEAYIRIKDIVDFEGVRDNVLVGYGLVVGLNGTGDNLNNSGFTQNTLMDHLAHFGVNTVGLNPSNLKTRNVAAVMVTGNLPGFGRNGSRFIVTVSAMGDAKSLKGGSLLATPLMGADGQVYAVAQGQVNIGSPSETDPTKARPIPTSGYVANGGTIEKEIEFSMNDMAEVRLALKNPDITTARAIASAINSTMRRQIAAGEDPGTVKVIVPANYRNNVLGLLAEIENTYISPDTSAKIIIDEITGTVIIGENVRISKVAVAQSGLVVKVSGLDNFEKMVKGEQLSTNNSPAGTKVALMDSSPSLSDLVDGLNALGVKTSDLVSIIMGMQKAGAIQATIEVR